MILLQGNMAGAKTPQERPISKNIARIANAVPVTLYSKVTNNVVLNCQQCNQCLKCQVSGHKNCHQKLSSKIVIKNCLKGRKSLRMLYGSVFQQCVEVISE